MLGKLPRLLLGLGLGITLLPGSAAADWWTGWPCRRDPETRCQWWCWIPCWPAPEHSHDRAGYGGRVSILAQPSNTPDYIAYPVGGGAVVGGEPRCLDDGTWGWDYSGHLLSRRIYLHWWHGRHYQGGSGQYQTDGPISPKSKPPSH